MSGGCICAICYEDVDPASDLLQAIAVCGHVFHELCLQQWVEFCPNGRAPTCPLCKQSCGTKDVHRLYFQSVSDSSRTKNDSNQQQPCQTSPSDGERAQDDPPKVRRLEAKVSLLTSECKASKEKILQAESEGQRHLEQVRVLEAEKLKGRKEHGQLMDSLARTREELRKTGRLRDELLERNEAMAKDLAVYKLATDVNLTEVDISRLISPTTKGSASSKDDTIDMMTKALFLQNRAFKDLMHKCQELGMGESRAEQKSEKLMEQVKRMKARMQEMAKAEEEKENAAVRSLTRTRISAETTRKPGFSLNDVNSGHLIKNASENITSQSRPHSKFPKVGESKEATSLPLAPVPTNVICLDSVTEVSEAQARGSKVNNSRLIVGSSEVVPAVQSSEGEEFSLSMRRQKNSGQVKYGPNHSTEAHSLSLGTQTKDSAGLWSDEEGFYSNVGGSSGSQGKPKLTIGLDGDIDNVDALRRRPTMLPIRQELGLGQGATSFTRPQSGTGYQMPATTDQTVPPSESSTFILSGADGRGGTVRVLKPPRLFPGGGGGSTNALGVMRGKRFKPTSHVAGPRPSAALKIEHFFGRG